ncbi:hypothetical protein Ciccas_014408 [Cichlidogyrus casuarinus]|uniref:Uncharacterized protein n=1 Tax=Cichlidogyrus casuarinus TaxID=1844966 RepID=A0ABD2PID6_9PLAT
MNGQPFFCCPRNCPNCCLYICCCDCCCQMCIESAIESQRLSSSHGGKCFPELNYDKGCHCCPACQASCCCPTEIGVPGVIASQPVRTRSLPNYYQSPVVYY